MKTVIVALNVPTDLDIYALHEDLTEYATSLPTVGRLIDTESVAVYESPEAYGEARLAELFPEPVAPTTPAGPATLQPGALIDSDERAEAFHMIFVTALEGGINYWSTCQAYRWCDEDSNPDTKDFYAHIYDTESVYESFKDDQLVFANGTGTQGEDTFVRFRIDSTVIGLGVQRYVEWAAGHPNNYFMRAAVDLMAGCYDELDVDADIADCIVQFGLFGEVIYG